MDNKEKPFAKRYAAILQTYGLTPSDLADLLDEPIAKFYKYKDGVMPRRNVLEKLLAKLPGLSPDFLFSGNGPVRLSTQQKEVNLTPALGYGDTIRTEVDRLKRENEDLRKELQSARDELREVRAELLEFSRDYRELTKLNFTGSSSQFTAMMSAYKKEVYNQIGFRQKNVTASFQLVDRFHPNVRVTKPKRVSAKIRLSANA